MKMRRDVKSIYIFSALSLIVAITAGVTSILEWTKAKDVGFTISEAETPFTPANFLLLLFGFATILSFLIAAYMNTNDVEYDKSLNNTER